VDHTTTPSNSSDNNVSFNESAFLRPVSESVSDTSVQSFSSDSESEESDWEENIFGDIEDFNFDSNSAGIKVDINDDSLIIKNVFNVDWITTKFFIEVVSNLEIGSDVRVDSAAANNVFD